MEPAENDAAPNVTAFPPTRWTWVDEASQPDEGRRLAALEAWLRLYYPALHSYVVRQFRLSEADAADCLQDFMVDKVIGRQLLERADRARGRFRTFLCQALKHFVIDRQRHQQARKRSPDQTAIPLESIPEAEFQSPTTGGTEAFDAGFFHEAVHETLRRMRRRCAATNRVVLWRLFKDRVLDEAFEGTRPVPYHRLLPLLNLDTSVQAANLLTTAKRLFIRTLRSVLRDYAATETELKGELRVLERVLARPPST